MATAAEHQEKANSHLKFLAEIGDEFPDWLATAAFYAAVELDDNPYRAPLTEGAAVGVLRGRHEDVRSVALYQKGILVCILLYLCAFVGQILLPQEMRIFVGLGILLDGLVGTAFVFLLSTKVYGVGLGIVLGFARRR